MKKIFKDLVRLDKKLSKILEPDDNCILLKEKKLTPNLHFLSLCREIIGQQLSVKAAKSIWERFIKGIKSNKKLIKKIQSIKIEDHKLHGLSRNKLSYLKELSEKFINKEIKFNKFDKMENEEIIDHLITIKGIGKWTAEMFLIFSMKRLDVFSVDDLGLRKAVIKLYKLKNDDREKILKISLKWKPYRSIVSWYLWRALDRKII
ncbi:DNA-3-methyladenine glycosylase 2 family protein [Alphaproteobacteria bacterium]|nr:DNA-3-methyladenine glycosylase 2 family protein [Alphaproteobacteria bacterium]